MSFARMSFDDAGLGGGGHGGHFDDDFCCKLALVSVYSK